MKYYVSESNLTFEIQENGNIKRLDINDHFPSIDWIVKGIVRFERWNSSKYIPFSDFQNIKTKTRCDDTFFTFKNGKPRCFIIDIDHGTTRRHGSGIIAFHTVT